MVKKSKAQRNARYCEPRACCASACVVIVSECVSRVLGERGMWFGCWYARALCVFVHFLACSGRSSVLRFGCNCERQQRSSLFLAVRVPLCVSQCASLCVCADVVVFHYTLTHVLACAPHNSSPQPASDVADARWVRVNFDPQTSRVFGLTDKTKPTTDAAKTTTTTTSAQVDAGKDKQRPPADKQQQLNFDDLRLTPHVPEVLTAACRLLNSSAAPVWLPAAFPGSISVM